MLNIKLCIFFMLFHKLNCQLTAKTNGFSECSSFYNGIVLSKLDLIINHLNEECQEEGVRQTEYLPVDCQQILDSGQSTGSGVYTVYNPVQPLQPRQVFCDMETDGGGWMVFQRRVSNAVDFNRGWAEYAAGFGDVTGNIWLGNELLHRLTFYKKQELRVDLVNKENVTAYAKYREFSVDTESDKYKIMVSGYSGTAGDSLSYHNGAGFSTRDRDYDTHSSLDCAVALEGAWWFKSCEHSSLNGPYTRTPTIDPVHYHGVSWDSFGGNYASMKVSEMKIRPL